MVPTTTTSRLRVVAQRLAPALCKQRSLSSSSTSRPVRIPRPRSLLSASKRNDERGRPHAVNLFPGDYSSDTATWDDPTIPNANDQDEAAADERLTAAIREEEEQRAALKAKWLANSQPPVRTPVIDERGRSYGRGGRKAATARVWIEAGLGTVFVNREPLDVYFNRESDRRKLLEPFIATGTCGKFDAQIIVQGGGLTGQAGAARLGVARALNHYNPDEYRPLLKPLKMLTRDARKVERKKVGHKKARKSPQWVRR